jgi:hypothetical protein
LARHGEDVLLVASESGLQDGHALVAAQPAQAFLGLDYGADRPATNDPGVSIKLWSATIMPSI